ncbi:MAG: LamG domain-containing protein [Bacteroidota bacterium]
MTYIKKQKIYSLCFLLGVLSCSRSPSDDLNLDLGRFGAFYTRIESDEEFEKYARVGPHSDIVVDLGKDDLALIFWRGSSYLPYLQSTKGKSYVEELIPRNGDGTKEMPDKTNSLSVVKLIENNPEQVVVLWRYLPEFIGGNPQLGVDPTKFVEEYFHIQADGKVKRKIKKGTPSIDHWRDSSQIVIQEFQLTSSGIEYLNTTESKSSKLIEKVAGNPVVSKSIIQPLSWWKFDEGKGRLISETVQGVSTEYIGNKCLWRKGVSGHALQLDGYTSAIVLPENLTASIKNELTLEAWVALGAYPWSYVPIIQQVDDNPEELLMLTGDRPLLTGEEKNEEDEGKEEEDEEDFDFVLKQEDDRGYFFGLDGYGKLSFKIRVGDKWEELLSERHLEKAIWYHVAATIGNGKMRIFINGKKVGEKRVASDDIQLSDKKIKIGKGKDRRPIRPVRANTFSDSYALDGLLDEIRIYDQDLSEHDIMTSYEVYLANRELYTEVDMDSRELPKGENRSQFGAYYTHLKFYDVWDNLWRFGDYPDVVVEFDNNPSKFIFWRGAGYIPMLANGEGQWYSNEFNETWNKSGGEGCQEPMSDKEAFTNHAKIIENTPARVVVQWRYPLLDVNRVMANYNEETGWCDWSEWYYYIYPDGLAVKSMKLWTEGERNHEWQESMAIFGPNQHPEEIINTKAALTMLNLDGVQVDYDWVNGPPESVEEPEGQSIQYINYTGEYKPITIGDFEWSDVYGGELTEYAVFPTWNHWPVAQMPSDGRYAIYNDRTAHSSLTHVGPSVYKEIKTGPTPYYQKILMEGMTKLKPAKLVPIARSWMQAPGLSNLKGVTGSYDKSQRAYILRKSEGDISFTIDASRESPLVNAAIVIKDWGDFKFQKMTVNGNLENVKHGFVRDTDGSNTLIFWLETTKIEGVEIRIT